PGSDPGRSHRGASRAAKAARGLAGSAARSGRGVPSHRAPDARERKEVKSMERSKVRLCPAGCGASPDVEIVGEEVRIGEAGNLAVLKREAWNLLVDLVTSGRLTKI